MGSIVQNRLYKLAKNKENFKMSKILNALKAIFKMFFEPDSLEEQSKDREIEYERNQWGYWK